jgi:hypothetical protein
MAGTGKYEHFSKEGTYGCAACGAPLYKSDSKFDSGCGWPAFAEAIPGAIKRFEDSSFGMTRIEIVCANCGGHLVFPLIQTCLTCRVMYSKEKDIVARMDRRSMNDTASTVSR